MSTNNNKINKIWVIKRKLLKYKIFFLNFNSNKKCIYLTFMFDLYCEKFFGLKN